MKLCSYNVEHGTQGVGTGKEVVVEGMEGGHVLPPAFLLRGSVCTPLTIIFATPIPVMPGELMLGEYGRGRAVLV